MSRPEFCTTWAIDTEWGFRDGLLEHESAWVPVVFCAVNVGTGERLFFWGDSPRLLPWLRDHAGNLFVAHYAIAEMKYLLRLGLPLPRFWFDTFVAWRALTNRPNRPEAGLSAALHRLGLQRLAPATKAAMQKKIANLDFADGGPADRREITDYCFSDCDGCAALFKKLRDRIRWERMVHWAEFLKAAARMELRGIPLDVGAHARFITEWPALREQLMVDVNRTGPVFVDGTFRRCAFFEWCQRSGIAWPVQDSARTGKPYRPLDNDTLKEMESHHPFIAEVRQVRKTLQQFGKRTMTIDPIRCRHYFSTSVFRSVTGRNQPRQFIFSGPKWLRFLIVPESSDHVLAYVDFVAQEIGVAAGLSDDPAMRAMYQASDCHTEFAIRSGAAPTGATKKSHGAVRKQYKAVNLGVLYGQTGRGIAARLGIGRKSAEALIDEHRRLFPTFWSWSDRTVQAAFDRSEIRTPCGWRSKVPALSNERTWMNWPMQSAGGDIMRLTISYLDRQNVRILAPIHDGFLLSCRRDQLEDLRAAVDYACRSAVEHVLPGFPLRWELVVYEERFEDEDGRPLWNRFREALGSEPPVSKVGALCSPNL